MIRRAKWIDDTTPEEPVSEAGRCALESRLVVVWRYLPLAAKEPEKDIEYVHQLRVATRRGDATLRVFVSVLPPRRGRKMSKTLKRIRKAAGDARELDVLALRLEAWSQNHPAAAGILKRVRKHRAVAQRPLVAIHKKLRKRPFPDLVEKLLAGIRWRGGENGQHLEPTFAVAARRGLGPLIEAFFSAAGPEFADIEAIHDFRLAGKRLRYAMEIYSGAMPAAFRRQLYPRIEHLQSLLGEINDHASAEARFTAWMETTNRRRQREALRELADAESRALAQAHDDFLQQWSRREIDALRNQFENCLA